MEKKDKTNIFFKKINIFNTKKNKKNKKNKSLKDRLKKIKIFNKSSDSFSYKEVIVIVICSMAVGGICIFSIMNIFTKGNCLTLSKDFNKLIETYNTITNNYYGEVDKKELIDNAITGMLSTVSDPYTTYIDSEASKTFLERVNGTYNGIGCEVYLDNYNNIIIGTVFENTPAFKSGLKTNDIVLSVDGVDYKNKTSKDLSTYIRSSAGKVKLEVKREEEVLKLELTPEKVEIPSVSTEIHEKNNKKVGYMYISIFSSVTDTQFKHELEKLEEKGIDSLIIDVRQNTGGYLDTVTSIVNMLLPKGKVIYQLENNDGVVKKYVTNKEQRDYPIAVLVDDVSASASEILAAAIKESYGGYVVGVNTYGKGTVQQTYDLEDGSMIKYTTQKWLTPNGNWINEVGVEPTDKIELTEEYFKNPSLDTDDQFQGALNLLTK